MNERIQELEKQCWSHRVDGTLVDGQLHFDTKKFAELIVRECVEQMELVRKYRYDRVQPLENQQTIIDECQYQIKQHFGVEQ